MKKITTDILIIGAGPAGLSCAMELAKLNKDFILIEKQSLVGGLAKTYVFNDNGLIFRTDNGPHRFFSKNRYLYDFMENLLGEDWISVKRKTRQYIDDKFYDYPVNFFQALSNVGFLKALEMALDYVVAKIQYGFLKKKILNFKDYAVANFGRSLGNFNIINYTEKIWGVAASEIHAEWASQRIKGLNLFSLIKNAIASLLGSKFKDEPKTLVDEFYYPKYGSGLVYENIYKKIIKLGYEIYLNSEPIEIRREGEKFISALIKDEHGECEICFNSLVESIPITEFVKLITPTSPALIFNEANKLRYRSQVYLFITFDKDRITNDQWIYLPNKDVAMARISEMKNFSSEMSPAGKTSLFIEFFCFENDNIWSMSSKELFKITLEQLESMNLFKKSEVRNYYAMRQKNVYPIYDLSYKDHLGVVKKYLDKFSNLYYIGRPGRFKYNNQDHSLEMGILTAKSIADNKRYSLDLIGEEKEYFEKGQLLRKNHG